MARGVIDKAGLERADIRALRAARPPAGMPFTTPKISHVVLKVTDIERSVGFYTEVMGFRVSDAYPETMMPGRMVFLRCNDDHHGIALVGGRQGPADNTELHHFAFEVGSLDELFRARAHLERHGVAIAFQGRRRAGAQIALEFADPDNHQIELCWGIDRISGAGASRPPAEWREAFSLEEAVRSPPKGQDTTLTDPSLMRN